MNETQIYKTLELAEGHRQAGRLGEARQLCVELLQKNPKVAVAWNILGIIAEQSDETDDAIEAFKQAVASDPTAPSLHRNLGMTLAAMGRPAEAVPAFRESLALRPESGETWNNLGNAFVALRDWDQAIEAFGHALQLDPESADDRNNLGYALQGKGQLELAVEEYRRALAIRPDFSIVLCNLGNTLTSLRRFDEAVEVYKKAIAIEPDFFEGWNQLANALNARGDFGAAMAAYEKVLEMQPRFVAAMNNMGNILHQQGKFAEAIQMYEKAIASQPDFATARWNMSLVQLLEGNFEEGWRNYEYRRKVEEFLPVISKFPQPMWDGGDLKGKRILLHTEQGLGDAIHFARYISLVTQRGGKVVLLCQDAMQPLFGTLDTIESCLRITDPLPAFDVHCPLPSLPFILGIKPPYWNVPYLAADPWRQKKFSESLGVARGQLKVGLVWAGRAHPVGRSVPLAMLAPLAHPEIQFYSLQIGEGSQEAKSAPAGMNLIDVSGQLRDFADTAGLIAGLDLMISIDTAAAQLAGAMGKKAWTLLKWVPDWRWLLERGDSPWYPTMKLFRQKRAGDWSEPIAEMGEELKKLVTDKPG